MHIMQKQLRNIAEASWFVNSVTVVIVIAGVLVGLETYPGVVERHHSTLAILDQLVLWIFVLEIVVKMGAEGKKPWRYFGDAWNIFDFIIVAAAFLPFAGNAVTVLRLLRLLRVLKLVRALPKLQVLVGALLKSIPSMGYVSVLLLLLFYIYAVAAVFLFAGNDPVHFENLQMSMLSLFRVVTLEDWTDIMYINMYGCDAYGYDASMPCTSPEANPVMAALFFVSFVLVGTMVFLNLFIGVIMNGMDEAHAEAEAEERAAAAREGHASSSLDDLKTLEEELGDVQKAIGALHRRMQREGESS
ncbi:MAG: ion transporter [Myxococcales bacterium]|nr:ion transporter [Myxococcales bacterium]